MAIPKVLLASLLISLLVLHLVQADVASSKSPYDYPKKIDCGSACFTRCKLSSRPRLCHRACGTCCKRCNCVPPGTAGNYEKCHCYATLTTHGGRRKCP
ncbi:PREDICTED: gibberellin-regulated protein 1-like isoform X2 [Tarenaya hassleriana]|uniref:gibberellin-regulated protein 1-like isoform X2 n=1 Tax=Tarenaya hassleriana TaxID=28532 RepID=UPI00053C1AD1|nr:PREDICTED: gibberellin-regulated protein 1-like isoform X2 [Tarenaya hassleriana]